MGLLRIIRYEFHTEIQSWGLDFPEEHITPINVRNRYLCIQTMLIRDSYEFKLGCGEAWLSETIAIAPIPSASIL